MRGDKLTEDLKIGQFGNISLDNQDYFHISKIEVITGDDDGNETDSIEIRSEKNKLIALKSIEPVMKKSTFRMRNEPGVRIFLTAEGGNDYVISICHHKGNIFAMAQLVD